MKGRLIKTQYNELGYALYIHPCSISNKLKEIPLLSLKNCQAIELGYDLDEFSSSSRKEFEVAYNVLKPKSGEGYDYYNRGLDFQVGVITGFQKALEILGDKKYSEQDVRDAYFHGEKDSYTKGGQTKEMENEFIQSLQQTEWDVDIVMEDSFAKNDEVYVDETNAKGNYSTHSKIPKLDPDGCLILKRI
jgi:hypothetical protein